MKSYYAGRTLPGAGAQKDLKIIRIDLLSRHDPRLTTPDENMCSLRE
jgi:hypothetical protein